MTKIFIPLSPEGGCRGSDVELRYALRSIATNWTGKPPEVVILGKPPAWASPSLAHMPAASQRDAHEVAAAHPGSFIWWMDDCMLLRQSSASDFKCPRRGGNLLRSLGSVRSENTWRRALEIITEELVKAGRTTHDFSAPHAPYVATGADFKDALLRFGRQWQVRMPLESWLLNDGREVTHDDDLEIRFSGSTPFREPRKNTRLLVFNDAGFEAGWSWLKAAFPTPSPWELPGVVEDGVSTRTAYALQQLHTAWLDAGAPPLRTICEVSVGLRSLLEPFERLCQKAIFVEPDPEMAEAARTNYPWASVHQVALSHKPGTAKLRRLKGSSYLIGTRWAPAHKYAEHTIRTVPEVSVPLVTFDTLDDGQIDLLNLDCEGSEWFVLSRMTSRPQLVQIELCDKNAFHTKIVTWFATNNYKELRRWGPSNVNRIFQLQKT